MSLSGSEKLMMERMNFETLKQGIKIEIEQRIESLTTEYQKWKQYNKNKKNFDDWLKLTENQLRTISSAAINLETPAKFQVSISKINKVNSFILETS